MTFVTVTRPFVVTTRTGFVIGTAVVLLTDCVVVAAACVSTVPAVSGVLRVTTPGAVRAELAAASVGDEEMLAGGFTTAAAVGESVRTLANAGGVAMALPVGVAVAAVVGAISGAPAFVIVVPPAVVPATKPASTPVANPSPAPLRIPSAGVE